MHGTCSRSRSPATLPASCADDSVGSTSASPSRRARSTPWPCASCRDRAMAAGAAAPVVANDRGRLIREVLTETKVRCDPGAALADIDWARARLDRPAATSRRPPHGAATARRCRATATSSCTNAYVALKKRRGVVDFDDLLADAARSVAARPRRSPTSCGGGSGTSSSTRPRTSTRCSTRCSSRSAAAGPTSASSAITARRSTAGTAPTRPPCSRSSATTPASPSSRSPGTTAARRRSCAAGAAALTAADDRRRHRVATQRRPGHLDRGRRRRARRGPTASRHRARPGAAPRAQARRRARPHQRSARRARPGARERRHPDRPSGRCEHPRPHDHGGDAHPQPRAARGVGRVGVDLRRGEPDPGAGRRGGRSVPHVERARRVPHLGRAAPAVRRPRARRRRCRRAAHVPRREGPRMGRRGGHGRRGRPGPPLLVVRPRCSARRRPGCCTWRSRGPAPNW